MATTKIANFKTMVGTVQNTNELPPTEGALVFNARNKMFYLGDGFNWLEIDIDTGSKLAVQTNNQHPETWSEVEAGDEKPIVAFDHVVYRRGVFEPIIGPPPEIEIESPTSVYIHQALIVSTPKAVRAVLRWNRNGSAFRQQTINLAPGTNRIEIEGPFQFDGTDRFGVTIAPDIAATLTIEPDSRVGFVNIEGP